MAKFHKLKVTDITRETADCVSVAFDIPPNLKNDFKYIQGQYVTLKLNINGEELRRSYSICSSPVADEEMRIAIKKVEKGRVSTHINQHLKVGDELEVMTPMGNFFTILDPAHQKNYVLFAGGSGITPMLSILKTIIHVEPKSTVQMFYGNLEEAAIIFKKHLDQLLDKHNNRLQVYHILDKPKAETPELYKGIMTPEKVKALIENHVKLSAENEFFICGPTAMMTNVENTLKELGVKKDNIHLEYFTVDTQPPKKPDAPMEGERINSKVTVIIDGIETVIDLPQHGEAILDAALDAGLDVPFACKGAVCCTCRAKVLEGKVDMEMNYALSESEVKEGYILTCQAHPLTPTVVVDYDQA